MNSVDVERRASEERESKSDDEKSSSEENPSTFKKSLLKVTRYRESDATSKIETDLSYEEFHYLPVSEGHSLGRRRECGPCK